MLSLVEIQLTTAHRRHATEAQMRSFVIVVPDEIVDGAAPCGKREKGPHVETFVVDGPKEALDFPVRLRRIGTEQMVHNAGALTGLLKARQPLGVERVAHRERKRVVGQHGLDRVRQRRRDALEKGGRGPLV